MQPIPITWTIAFKVLLRHNQIANSMTFMLLLMAGFLGLLATWLAGFQVIDYWSFLLQYKWYFLGVFLVIHFSWANVYAVKRLLTHSFGNLRLVVVRNNPPS